MMALFHSYVIFGNFANFGFFERTKKFTNEFSNPTFMKDYSIIQTNGTLYLEVTDGNGLGGKTTRELKIIPGSC